MKKLFILFVSITLLCSCKVVLNAPITITKGDIRDYSYAYIIPTSAVTANSGVYGNVYGVYGGSTRTANPAETISGYLMKNGYTIVPSVTPDLAARTLVVSYGYTGRRRLSASAYTSSVIIQMRDATTQELVASFEAEGCGEDEAEDIYLALQRVFREIDKILQPALPTPTTESVAPEPKFVVKAMQADKYNVLYKLTNNTPDIVKQLTISIAFYSQGELMHRQESTITVTINPGESTTTYVKREKPARNSKYIIDTVLLDYK